MKTKGWLHRPQILIVVNERVEGDLRFGFLVEIGFLMLTVNHCFPQHRWTAPIGKEHADTGPRRLGYPQGREEYQTGECVETGQFP